MADRDLRDARRRIELELKRPDLLAIVEALVAEMTVLPSPRSHRL